jgi:MerR family transcriptional regulator, light-induced transcriptional regulator
MQDLNQLFEVFSHALNTFQREEALTIALEALETKNVDIPTLYELILAPSLNQVASNEVNQEIPIWVEHVKSNIIRTVIENAYAFVLKDRVDIQKKAIVLCLEEEYHELGARMSADYLTLLGFDALFIGANTPKKEVISAIETLKPDVVCISVTNYFHLTRLQSLIEQLPHGTIYPSFKLVIGGYAVHHSSNVKELVKADYYIKDFQDLKRMQEDFL